MCLAKVPVGIDRSQNSPGPTRTLPIPTGSSRRSHVVEDAEEHPKGHVGDPKDDRHLHLEGVEEAQVVGGQAPDLGQWEKWD